MLSHSIVSDSLRPQGAEPHGLLCPWNFPGRNPRVDCYFLLQGIFLTWGWNSSLLHLQHWQADSLPLCHLRSLDIQTDNPKSVPSALSVRCL